MSVQEIANKWVVLCREGKFDQAHQDLYHQDAVSVEPDGAPYKETRGLTAIREKGKHFQDSLTAVHEISVSDPVVADRFFTASIAMDVEMTGVGRMKWEEIAVYETKDDKIISESFYYTPVSSPDVAASTGPDMHVEDDFA